MTLIISYILLANMNAHWVWYPVVFLVWLLHVLIVASPSSDDIARKVRRWPL